MIKMITEKKIPQHIAMIMDGNGRWAKSRHLPRIAGHKKGVDVVRKMLQACDARGVKFLTLYAFSTENWKRSSKEVNFLMHLLNHELDKAIQNFMENNVRFLTIGRKEGLPKKVLEVLTRAKDKTKDNTGISLIIAFNYGGRAEIVDAAKGICEDVQKGVLSIDEIVEDTFKNYLYTEGIPDPDLLIRTSGEMRISNFLLWQLSYSEFYISPEFWPDFNEVELDKGIAVFQKRDRRYGAVQEPLTK